MLVDDLLSISPGVRYVAVYRGGALESRERAGLSNASASESDKYEELIVNPALLTLVRQRGPAGPRRPTEPAPRRRGARP